MRRGCVTSYDYLLTERRSAQRGTGFYCLVLCPVFIALLSKEIDALRTLDSKLLDKHTHLYIHTRKLLLVTFVLLNKKWRH